MSLAIRNDCFYSNIICIYMKINVFLFSFAFLIGSFFSSFSQSRSLCDGIDMNATPFCTDLNPYGVTYSVGTTGYATELHYLDNTGCLDLDNGGDLNPAWYKMKMSSNGTLNIFMSHSNGCDVDYACWGPFTDADMENMCRSYPYSLRNYLYDNLPYNTYYWEYYDYGPQFFSHHPTYVDNNYNSYTYGMSWTYDWYTTPSGKLVDCSATPSATEWVHIRNAQVGQWYILFISNWEGCPGSINFSRDASSTAHTDCTITAPVQGDEVCEGETATIAAAPVSGAVSYRWSGPNGFSQTTSEPSVTIPNVTIQHSGSYSVEVYNGSVYGTPTTCSLVVHPLPNVTVSSVTICAGESATLTASGANNYEWNTGATGATFQVSPTTTTIYTVTGTATAGNCSATATASVTVIDSLTPFISPNPVCVGELAMVHAPPGVTYLWSNGSTGSTFRPAAATPSSHTVVVSTSQGCTGSATLYVSPSPIAEFTADYWNVNIENPVIQFTDLSVDAVAWEWNFGEHSSSGNSSTQQHPSYAYSHGGTFVVTLTVTSENGCTHTTSHAVIVTGDEYYLYIPSAYTPNVDGRNELFQPQGRGVEEYEIIIYSRWGDIIYQSQDFEQYWDGKLSNGKKAPMGTYVYKIRVLFRDNSERIYKGTVTLIR